LRSLVFLEHHDGQIQKGSLGVLSRAAQLGGEVAGVLAGKDVRGLAEQAGSFGAQTVFVADDPRLEAPLPQPRVDVLAQLVAAEGYENVLLAQSVLAADVAGGLAARLEAARPLGRGGAQLLRRERDRGGAAAEGRGRRR
jgi:electron transfer flavoprotein alpha subunit